MHVFQRFLISLRNLHQGAALASSVSGMWKDTSLMIERERIYEWCQSTETSCRITSDLGYRKHFLIVEKGRTFGRKWKHTFGSQSPTFEKKNPQNLKKKRFLSAVFWQNVYFSSVWTTSKLGGWLCSPPEGADSWRCSMACINLLCLPDFSSLISLLCICQ